MSRRPLSGVPARRALRLLVRGLLRVPRPEPTSRQPPAASGGAAQHLMLAVLSMGPGSTDDLLERYARRFGVLVPLTRTSADRMLPALVRCEQAASNPAATARRFGVPARSYRITETGLQAARGWVLSPVRPERWRQELLARIDAASILGVDALHELLSRYEQARGDEEHELRLQLDELPESQEALGHRLALQERLDVLERQGQWALQARGRLQERRP